MVDATQAWAPPRPSRNKWIVPALGAALILGLVLAGTMLFGREHGQKSELTNTALENDGLPHTLQELDAWYVEPPAGQNAATFYAQGFAALQIDKASPSLPLLGPAKLPPLGDPMPPAAKAALSALVHSNREALQLLVHGEKYEQSRFPLDLTQGFDLPMPHLPKVRNATLLAESSAILHAEGNDGTQAAQDVLLALALTRSLEAEPSLISQSMRAASVSIAVAALEQILNRTTLPPESLSQLATTLKKIEDHDASGEGFNRAIAAERVIWTAMFGMPQKLLPLVTIPGTDLSEAERKQIMARLQKSASLKEEGQYFETAFQQLMAARKEPFPERLKTGELIRHFVTDASRQKLVVLQWLLPALANPSVKEAGSLAHCRLGLTATALEQFRAAHDNHYPPALSALTPDYLAATPKDPFDGEPLRYRTAGSGYRLYSIGPDLKADSWERIDGKDGNIAFAVVRPGKPGK